MGKSNYEMRFEVMADRPFVTPNSLFYIRNHSQTPLIDPTTWRLRVEGDGVSRPLDIGYDDLLKMPSTTVARFVECAGNGRKFYASVLGRPAQGGQGDWALTGLRNGPAFHWRNCSTAPACGQGLDVMPTGLDSMAIERPIPAVKAREGDTIVAYMMNGDLLPPDHGFPARLITPGWVGINNIKWVGKITVSMSPLYVDKNTNSYVLVGPGYEPQGPSRGPRLTTQVMKSAVCLPFPAELSPGRNTITGYAWSPFGTIASVDVSTDGGESFRPATLVGPNIERAGTRWQFSFEATPGPLTIMARAADDRGNAQYPATAQQWNQFGYAFGAMAPHPVTVRE